MTQRRILAFWAPVAFMWLLMAVEQPVIAASIARLPDPEPNLAAFGLTFAFALIVESPVIMLLTAGTALARGAPSYARLVRFTTILALGVGGIHLLVGVTPAYGWLAGDVVGAPEPVVDLGRTAFLLMLPWSPAIAYRRLWQGVLIRYDRTARVSLTTLGRVAALAAACVLGVWTGALAGASLGGLALSAAVVAGAIGAYALVRETVSERLTGPDPEGWHLDTPELLRFYVPLALTSFIVLGGQPLLSVGLARAPDALVALAVWPVVASLTFVFRSGGYAHQEVVIALHDRPGAADPLRRFTLALAAALSGGLLVLAATPLADLWLSGPAGLSDHLVEAGRLPLLLLVPAPGLSVLVSWYRGRLVSAARTTVVTQAVALNLATLAGTVGIAVALGSELPGAALAALALTLSLSTEAAFLALRCRGLRA